MNPTGTLRIGSSELEYRMIGPPPDAAPTIVMLHEGLGSAGLWGDFPEKLAASTGAGVLVYSRAGYGASSPVPLPRPLDYMHVEALDVLPKLLDAIPQIKHEGSPAPMTMTNMQAFHRTCVGCHTEVKKTKPDSKGPTQMQCVMCHKKTA